MGEITETTYTSKEILAEGCLPHAIPVTLKSDQSDLKAGTVLGRITADGLYKAYNDGNNDGSEVALGILAEDADPAGEGRNIPVAMYLSGSFVEAKLTGLDGAAKGDLNARTVEGRLVVPGAS